MGLLSRIAAGVENIPPAEDFSNINEGLTETTVETNTEVSAERLSFFDFTVKHSLTNTGIFAKDGVFYSFNASKGFDSDTILQSLSTSDFWEGTIKENSWSVFSREDNNLNTMLQFFSNELKNSFDFICIYENGDYILLCAFTKEMPSYEELKAIAEDFKKTDCCIPYTSSNVTGKQITVDLTDAIDQITGKLAFNIKTLISNAFTTEAFYMIEKLLYGSNTMVKSENNKITFTFDSNCHITDSALKTFLNTNFKKLFKNSSSLIKYEC